MGRNGLRERKLKKESEGLYFDSHRAAQDQALRTNSAKKLIENRFKTDVSRHAECVEKE